MTADMGKPQQPTLEDLYRSHGRHVYRRCLYLLGDDQAAWDATQDVFLKAERARASFEGRSSWLTWLVRIATHHCLNLLRAGRVRRGAGLVGPEALDHEGRCHPGGERAAQVREVLRLFDTKTQALAVHYFVDEMSQEEVAAAVGLSVPTVRKRLRDFVRRARRELEPGPAASGRT